MPMHCAPQRIGAGRHLRVIGRDIHVLGHHLTDNVELALTFFGQRRVVGMTARQAEHQREDPGLGAGEVDVGLSKRDDALGIAGRMGLRRRLHRGTHSVHRAQHDAMQDFIAVLEVPVGRGRADTGPATGFGNRERLGSPLLDKLPHRLKKLIFELPVVVVFLEFYQ